MLSIILVTNDEQRLKDILVALKRQSDKNFELVLADTSKHDRVLRQIKGLHLKYFKFQNTPIARIYNSCLRNSAGERVAFLNEYFLPDEEWASINRLAKEPVSVRKVAVRLPGTTPKKTEELFADESEHKSLIASRFSSVCFDKAKLLDIGGFDNQLSTIFVLADAVVRLNNKFKISSYQEPLLVDSKEKLLKKLDWHGYSLFSYIKDYTYFHFKNSWGLYPFKLVQTLHWAITKRATYKVLFKSLQRKNMNMIMFFVNLLIVNIATWRGLMLAMFSRRALVRMTTNSKFIIFAKS